MEQTRGQQLHDRATRGSVLSEAERAELEAWYAQQDAEENKLLTKASEPLPARLYEQVDDALAQAEAAAAHVRTLAAENKVIRHDIDLLYQKLAQTTHSSAA